MTAGTEQPELTSPGTGTGIDAAADAARRVIESLLRSGDRGGTDLDTVADRLNAVADDLDRGAPDLAARMVHMWRGDGVTRHDPVTGPENAIAPPLHLTGCEDGSVEATVELGLAHQGPPGYVHGGMSALLLDHTLGVANHWAGLSGMTAELTLRYLRPTPLFTPLTVAAHQVSVDGRRIRTSGSISADGRECVRAEGLFVATHPARPR
ncbi:PaaI family thioesterase [Nocardiopsis sp. HNM0947]|uniref:PaaI family thioesterase n=1 Tax=Nocardiopsis coralli TaxID=2772213 RepID=A0ABR9PEV7_9ACTN|nr:PaaI family thioesterase [Nocardiopsis coralli]MBE3002382.1 PaaI family thioesterase [Nocardiopsis coralli]